jgi:CheY-like chemotaxis protein
MEDPIPEPEMPDVALLDIRMPGGPDGHELAAHMRRHPSLSNIAIILMTAYELPGSQRDEVLTVSGADQLFFKPLPPMEELAETARRIVARRQNIS